MPNAATSSAKIAAKMTFSVTSQVSAGCKLIPLVITLSISALLIWMARQR